MKTFTILILLSIIAIAVAFPKPPTLEEMEKDERELEKCIDTCEKAEEENRECFEKCFEEMEKKERKRFEKSEYSESEEFPTPSPDGKRQLQQDEFEEDTDDDDIMNFGEELLQKCEDDVIKAFDECSFDQETVCKFEETEKDCLPVICRILKQSGVKHFKCEKK